MAMQGWLVGEVKRRRYTFRAVAPGAWHVHVEPCVRLPRQHRVVGPASAVVLACDPSTRVVSTDRSRLIAVCPTVARGETSPSPAWPTPAPDPVARVNPLARAAGYRRVIRQGRAAGIAYLALLLVPVGLLVFAGFVLVARVGLPSGLHIDAGFLVAIFALPILVEVVPSVLIIYQALVSFRLARGAVACLRARGGPRPAANTVIVHRRGLAPVDKARWLEEQAACGWTIASYDGGSEYVFEATTPGQFRVAVEAGGRGFSPVYLVDAAPGIQWPAPAEALAARPDAEVVGSSPDWVIARRPAQYGPLTPPWPVGALITAYGQAADRVRRAIPRTAALCIVCAVFAVLFTVIGFSLVSYVNVAIVLSVASMVLLVATMGVQWAMFARRAKALGTWAARYARSMDLR